MATLKERLLEDMKKAMKEKDKKRLSVIRMTRSEIKNEEINSGNELNDDDVIEVLARQVKQIKDSLADFEKSGKQEVMDELYQEIEILEEYLPEKIAREELEKLIDEAIAETGAQDMSEMGQVMGAVMPQVKGRANGREVSEIVRQKLS